MPCHADPLNPDVRLDDVRAAIVAMNAIVKYSHDHYAGATEIVVDLSRSDLRGAMVSGVKIQSLESSDVSGATLDRIDFRGTAFRKATATHDTCITNADPLIHSHSSHSLPRLPANFRSVLIR
jgi:uncharacterized protein YjbI with pentapeptide repeats